MSEEKEHPASEKKLKKARDEGQDPQSPEIYDFCDVVVGYMTLTIVLPPIFGLIVSLLRFDHLQRQVWSLGGADEAAITILTSTLLHLTPTLAGSCLVAGLLGYLGNRRRLPNAVPPKLSYNPLKKAAGMFKPDQILSSVRGWLVAVLIMAFAIIVCGQKFSAIVGGGFCTDQCDAVMANGIIWLMLAPVVFIKAFGAIIDVVMKQMKFAKDQKMSHDEVKRENKEDEGDPHVKGKRKQIAREIAEGR
jgi:flagellar biosynthesis protein FlhB